MWTSNDILVLSFATLNFTSKEITWMPGGFTPKRRNALLAAIEKNFGIDVEKLQTL
jgi:hypothetical protein